MDGVRENIVVEGREYWTLFDSGAKNSYVVADLAVSLHIRKLQQARAAVIGGVMHRIEEMCFVQGSIQGLPITMSAYIVPEIGTDEEGNRIDILLGRLEMREWGIVPIPEEGRIDMTHYQGRSRNSHRRCKQVSERWAPIQTPFGHNPGRNGES